MSNLRYLVTFRGDFNPLVYGAEIILEDFRAGLDNYSISGITVQGIPVAIDEKFKSAERGRYIPIKGNFFGQLTGNINKDSNEIKEYKIIVTTINSKSKVNGFLWGEIYSERGQQSDDEVFGAEEEGGSTTDDLNRD